MKTIQLSAPYCSVCKMMSTLLGDRVEHVNIADRPDLVALTSYTSIPIFLVMDGDTCKGSFYGHMPLSVWQKKVDEIRAVTE